MVQQKLEQKLLQNGISTTKVHEKKIFPNYTQEIIGFNKDMKKKNKVVPFENQTKPFMQALRHLNSQNPYVVFVGEPGIGKSMMLEYIVDVISQNIPLSKVKKNFPQSIPIFEEIIAKAHIFEPKDYLFLPNLRNPNFVKPLSYNDSLLADDDYSLASEFGLELSCILNSYINPDNRRIKQSLPKSSVNKYIKSKVYELINSTYQRFINMNDKIPNNNFDNIEPISIIDYNVKNKIKVNYEILSKINTKNDEVKFLDDELKKFAGFTTKRTNITFGELEKGISNTYLLKKAESDINFYIDQIKLLDVKEHNTKQLISMFKNELNVISTDLTNEIKIKYDNSKIKNQSDLFNFIKKKNKKSYFNIMCSNETINEIYEELDELWIEYKDYTSSGEIKTWMKDSISYFKEEKSLLKEILTTELMEQESEQLSKHLNENKNSKDEKEKENEKKGNKKMKQFSSFYLPHGDESYEINHIFDPTHLKGNGGNK
ncbi:hypothetical protein HN415_04040, partial [Candidatus Woesearchaeota archaeon]|nr:hypothetical protein [Candidatus Woesearchaeota archaeon]